MSAVEKFMFDVPFDDVPTRSLEKEIAETPVEEEEVEEIIPTFSEEEVEQARQEGFEAGKIEGLAATTEELTKHIAASLAGIDQKLTQAFQTQTAANAELHRAALAVGVGIARKMFPALAERNAFDEVERVVLSVFDKIIEEPRITFSVHPGVITEIEKRISEISVSKGYEGLVTVHIDETLAASDCKVEWANGGIERDTHEMWRDINRIIVRNLSDEPTKWDLPNDMVEETLDLEKGLEAPETLTKINPEETAGAAAAAPVEADIPPVDLTEPGGNIANDQKPETETTETSPEAEIPHETATGIVEDVMEEQNMATLPDTDSQPEKDTDS